MRSKQRLEQIELEQIVNALPIIEDRRGDIAHEAASLWYLSVFGDASPRMCPTPIGTKQVEGELLALIKRIRAFRSHIAGMHQTICDAMEAYDEDRNGLIFDDGLTRMENAARGVLQRVRSGPAVKLTGRPRKVRAERIATYAAEVFERLTGMPATVSFNPSTSTSYGPFLDFLKAVFEACGIAASAEAHAKAVRRKLRSKKGVNSF